MTYLPGETIRLANAKEQSLIPHKPLTTRRLPTQPSAAHQQHKGMQPFPLFIYLFGNHILIHSEEELLNFLMLTQQQIDRLNRLPNPSPKKRVKKWCCRNSQAREHFLCVLLCMTCAAKEHRAPGPTAVSTVLIGNRRMPWGAPGEAWCWCLSRRPGFCSCYCSWV